MTTTAEILLARAREDTPALLFGDQAWTYRQLVDEGRRRAAFFEELHDSSRPPHIGVLLDSINKIKEKNESNNTRARSIQIFP